MAQSALGEVPWGRTLLGACGAGRLAVWVPARAKVVLDLGTTHVDPGFFGVDLLTR